MSARSTQPRWADTGFFLFNLALFAALPVVCALIWAAGR